MLTQIRLVGCISRLNFNQVASGSSDSSLRVWNLKSGECEKTLNRHTDWISCILKIDSKQLISAKVAINQ